MFGQYYIDEECGKGNVCEIDYDINIIDNFDLNRYNKYIIITILSIIILFGLALLIDNIEIYCNHNKKLYHLKLSIIVSIIIIVYSVNTLFIKSSLFIDLLIGFE